MEFKNTFVPKLIVFDLDFTLWYPEMYELSGPPFKKKEDTNTVLDRSNEEIYLFKDVVPIFQEIFKKNSIFEKNHSKVAVASKTTYPKWAMECMELFTIPIIEAYSNDKRTLRQLIDYEAIYPKNKKKHFLQFLKESDISYEHMLFFDNEYYNITDIEPLGVTCIHCPNGLTFKDWRYGLEIYDKKMKNKNK